MHTHTHALNNRPHTRARAHQVANSVFEKELNLRKAFHKWDGDGSGALDVNELTFALNELGFTVSTTEAGTYI